mmetsp:Transcript_18074/g.30355  ORF Transcript_18074/g.30355 Transcript_18074/m.30355 type:complete len:471 (+) Transcript_18074:138-1550(+)
MSVQKKLTGSVSEFMYASRESFTFESENEGNINAEDLSDLSDEFENDAEAADVGQEDGADLALQTLALDDITYDRDVKWINIPNGARPKPRLMQDNRFLKQIEAITSSNSKELTTLDAHYNKMDERKREHEGKFLVDVGDTTGGKNSRRRHRGGGGKALSSEDKSDRRHAVADIVKPAAVSRRSAVDTGGSVGETNHEESDDENKMGPYHSSERSRRRRAGDVDKASGANLVTTNKQQQQSGKGKGGKSRTRKDPTTTVGTTVSINTAALEGESVRHGLKLQGESSLEPPPNLSAGTGSKGAVKKTKADGRRKDKDSANMKSNNNYQHSGNHYHPQVHQYQNSSYTSSHHYEENSEYYIHQQQQPTTHHHWDTQHPLHLQQHQQEQRGVSACWQPAEAAANNYPIPPSAARGKSRNCAHSSSSSSSSSLPPPVVGGAHINRNSVPSRVSGGELNAGAVEFVPSFALSGPG